MYIIQVILGVIIVSILSTITWLLIHLTIWAICLVILIPLLVALCVLVKDLMGNDGKKIKREIVSLFKKIEKTFQSESVKENEKLSIKNHKVKNKNEKPETTVNSSVMVQNNPMNSNKNSDKFQTNEGFFEEQSDGIIYLDKRTSLTTYFSNDEKEKS